jgi:hypothetical protein
VHKSPRSARQVVELFSYGRDNDDAKVSKSPIRVNKKIAEIVIYRNEERIHAKGWLRKKYIFMLPDISEKRNLR